MRICFYSFILTFLLGISLTPAYADIYTQLNASYHTETDKGDIEEFEYSHFRSSFFLGASYGKKGRFIIGQNAYYWKRENTGESLASETQDITMLEIGPKFILFFNENRNFYISGAYHFYARGTRKYAQINEKMRGWGALASIGIQRSVSKSFYLGFSLNYHYFDAKETETDQGSILVDEVYSTFYPALDFSIRF